jgi:hypothetical protein
VERMRSAIPPDLTMTNVMGGEYAEEDEHKFIERLMTQFEMTTSTLLSGSGIASIIPCKNCTFSIPASCRLRSASSNMGPVMSSP